MSKLPRAMRGVRRVWPLVLLGWERWQALPPDKKESYKRQARQYAERGRKLIDERRPGGPGRRSS